MSVRLWSRLSSHHERRERPAEDVEGPIEIRIVVTELDPNLADRKFEGRKRLIADLERASGTAL
jgi:hypothetical protein